MIKWREVWKYTPFDLELTKAYIVTGLMIPSDTKVDVLGLFSFGFTEAQFGAFVEEIYKVVRQLRISISLKEC
jgi:hypothetical protein